MAVLATWRRYSLELVRYGERSGGLGVFGTYVFGVLVCVVELQLGWVAGEKMMAKALAMRRK